MAAHIRTARTYIEAIGLECANPACAGTLPYENGSEFWTFEELEVYRERHDGLIECWQCGTRNRIPADPFGRDARRANRR